jgi:hypothetical protein
MFSTKLTMTAAVLLAASAVGFGADSLSSYAMAGEEPAIEKPTRSDAWRLPKEATECYAVLLPRAEELKYRDIPWLVDLADAVAVANEEKRPILIWVSGDEPLELC